MAPGKALSIDLGTYLRVHHRPHRLVKIALRAFQPHMLDDLGLGRQLAGDLLLGPSYHERLEPAGQKRLRGPVPVLLDRRPESAPERALVTQQAWVQELEQRPHLAQ